MKKVILFLLLIYLMANTLVFAGQRYNPYTLKWETASKEAELIFTPFGGEWEYVEPESEPEYNSYERKWEHYKYKKKKER